MNTHEKLMASRVLGEMEKSANAWDNMKTTFLNQRPFDIDSSFSNALVSGTAGLGIGGILGAVKGGLSDKEKDKDGRPKSRLNRVLGGVSSGALSGAGTGAALGFGIPWATEAALTGGKALRRASAQNPWERVKGDVESEALKLLLRRISLGDYANAAMKHIN